ncbi:hypothetical protein AAVH_20269 [Aphelenchoides avenae]|nr:hypothetical protein AAVH_20269 [Aphelenchus avenae]
MDCDMNVLERQLWGLRNEEEDQDLYDREDVSVQRNRFAGRTAQCDAVRLPAEIVLRRLFSSSSSRQNRLRWGRDLRHDHNIETANVMLRNVVILDGHHQLSCG